MNLTPIAILLSIACAACQAPGPTSNTQASPAAPSAVHGIDTSAIDRSIAPGQDFYAFANGAWLARTEIPADRSTWGPTEAMTEEAARRTRELLEEAGLEKAGKPSPAPGSIQQQAADYYASYMDEAGIEAKGLAPLKNTLDRIAAIDSPSALARLLGEDLRADVDALNNTNFHTDRLFGVWITANLNEPSKNVPYLLQGGLDLPDRE